MFYKTLKFYRVVCFAEARGPWRADREQARRDAIEQGLGQYDEHGRYYSTVPGAIQRLELPLRVVEAVLTAERKQEAA
jgi:hypothetical protein